MGGITPRRRPRPVRQTTSGALDVEEGALYPALHRLEKRGLSCASWGRTDTNRRAKFCTLTDEGRARLRDEGERWEAYAQAVGEVLTAEPGT